MVMYGSKVNEMHLRCLKSYSSKYDFHSLISNTLLAGMCFVALSKMFWSFDTAGNSL